MNRRYVITRVPVQGSQPLICAVCEEHKLHEVTIIPEHAPAKILHNIYIGRVSQVVKNINAAFVEIAKGVKCYLPLSDVKQPVFVKRITDKQVLSQGDELVVQVVKEAVKTKEPQVSTTISLAGLYAVVTNETCTLGISGKLTAEQKKLLREGVQDVYNQQFGVIVRTNAIDAPLQLVCDEIRALQEQIKHILQHAPYQTHYSLLHEAPPEYIRMLQNQKMEQIEQIVTDEPTVYEQLIHYMNQFPSANLKEKLHFYDETQLKLHKLYALEVQMERALQRKVWLKSGANILIEPTEAMTVIDVNSGKNVKKKLPQEQHLNINLEAAKEIAHQLRLRNISGIIIIDFIDMKSAEAQAQLLTAMRSFVKSDSVQTEVIDLTRLGLMELTRKKTRKSLQEQFMCSTESEK